MNIFKKKNKNVLTRIFRKKSKLEKFYLKNKKIKEYERYLQEMFRYKEHTLSDIEEKLLANLSNNKRKLLIGQLFIIYDIFYGLIYLG